MRFPVFSTSYAGFKAGDGYCAVDKNNKNQLIISDDNGLW